MSKSAHIAMVVPSWIGHLNPMTTLGRELKRRGHRVSVVSFADSAERIVAAGLEHAVLGADAFPAGQWVSRSRALSKMAGMAAAKFTVDWLARTTGVMLSELPDVLGRGDYDGVVMDQVCFGAECAVEEAGLPLAVACNALPVHLQPDIPVHSETWPWRTDRVALLRNRLVQRILVAVSKPMWGPIRRHRLRQGRRWDIWEYMNHIPPSLAHVAQLPACLDFPRGHAPDHFHHTGPWHEPALARADGFDWGWLDGRPMIYASLGTLQNGLDYLYQAILEACAEMPVQVVVALGREDGSRPSRIPENALVVGYAPQLALLQKASMAITHGGMNTTLEALAQGLPMVAMPITNEQPGIASRIRHAGVGDWVSIRRLTPARLRSVVERVLENPTYRERARACAAEMERGQGLARAAEIVEEALVTGRRVVVGKSG